MQRAKNSQDTLDKKTKMWGGVGGGKKWVSCIIKYHDLRLMRLQKLRQYSICAKKKEMNISRELSRVSINRLTHIWKLYLW